MATDIMIKLGLKKDSQIGETSRVKKDKTSYMEKSPDKLVRSPKKDTFTSSEKTDNKDNK
ncbi:MAG: hypothetical protein KH301_07290 [Brachyspira sp.]|nr:hypothetical protein [Brachyspira sp.]